MVVLELTEAESPPAPVGDGSTSSSAEHAVMTAVDTMANSHVAGEALLVMACLRSVLAWSHILPALGWSVPYVRANHRATRIRV